MKPLVVVGSINLDLVASTKRIPSAGETILATGFETFHGGKGANQAVAVAKLGHPVTMIGCVGSDDAGGRLREGLANEGVDVRGVKTVQGPSGTALICCAESGENSIVVVPGANSKLSCAEIDGSRSLLSGAGMVLAQLETPLETIELLAEVCNELGTPLMLDPAPAAALTDELLQKIAWLTPNESEAALLLGGREQTIDPPSAARSFLNRGVRNVALKLGERGVYLAIEHDFTVHVPGFRVTPIDTTAAGDIFNAAFAVALMRNEQPEGAARYACAAAAISVTRSGAQPSVPTATEVEEFLACTQ